jgi:cysteine-rich secretory family protein
LIFNFVLVFAFARREMMRKTLCLAAFLVASVAVADEGTESSAPQQAKPLHRHPALFGMLVRNNSIRRRVGLRPHRINPALTKAAQDQANYMARTGQFSHYVNGGPQARAGKYGFRGGVRENIAMGTRSIDGAFTMWTNSGAHYASIVSGTTEAGFGYAISPGGQTYWVGVYGTPPAGDATGETEEFIAQVLEEERQAAAKLAAEKTAAEKDPDVKPASATLDPDEKPASKVQPAAATESAVGK